MSIVSVTPAVRYIGVYDQTLDLFEGQYPVPTGVTYNSYLILDQKTALMDTVDARATEPWLQNLAGALEGRTPDYLVVSHMEPDHAANILRVCQLYPQMQVVGNVKTFAFMDQFFGAGAVPPARRMVVKEGDTLALGAHTLTFAMAPMVHWPEVMVSYEASEKLLFSADAFGTFGPLQQQVAAWPTEARRYYCNIVGKYGVQAQALLKKAAALDIATVCPLHGPILAGEALAQAVKLYGLWASYEPEAPDAVLVASASIYGNTRAAAHTLAQKLRAKGAEVVEMDLARTDKAAAVAEAFRCGKLVLACSTYDGGILPAMESFLAHIKAKGLQKRTVALVENGTWAPMAAKHMRAALEGMKNMQVCEATVTLRSAANAANEAQMDAVADALLG